MTTVLTDRRDHVITELRLLGPGMSEAPLGSNNMLGCPGPYARLVRGGPGCPTLRGPRPAPSPARSHSVTAGGWQRRSCTGPAWSAHPKPKGWEVGSQGWWGLPGKGPSAWVSRRGVLKAQLGNPERLSQGPPRPAPSSGPGAAGPGALLGRPCLGVRWRSCSVAPARRWEPSITDTPNPSPGVWAGGSGSEDLGPGHRGPRQQGTGSRPPDGWGQQGSTRPRGPPPSSSRASGQARPGRARPGRSVDVLWTRTLVPRWLLSTSLPPAQQGCP